MHRRYRAGGAILLLLGGCGGITSAGNSRPVAGAIHAVATAPAAATGRAIFTITIPAAAGLSQLKAKYVSAETLSFTLAANGGTPSVTTVTPGQATYTAVLDLPVGPNSFAAQLFDAANGTGNVLAAGSTTGTITAGKDNPLHMVLTGVVASLQLTPATLHPASGTASDIALTVTALDAGGGTITGSYDKTISLAGPSAGGQVVASTLAGSGSFGAADGPAATAKFALPYGVAVDSSGAVYVADAGTSTIRKISGGTVTTIAGSGQSGLADGPAATAKFTDPYGVAVDSAGNVYVADSGNNRIRKISGGTVSTLAGSNTVGYADGPVASALFAIPYGVAVDGNGAVYVADAGSNTIRKISNGTVSTLAGSLGGGLFDGAGAAGLFTTPNGLAVDGSGNVYVSDTGNGLLRRIDAAGNVTTLAAGGSFSANPASAAAFSVPYGVAASAGAVYVADAGSNTIRKLSSGALTTFAGNGTAGFSNGPPASAQFSNPFGVAVDGSGAVYVADTANSRIRKLAVSPPSVTLSAASVQDSTTAVTIHYNGQNTSSQVCATATGVPPACVTISPT